MLSSMLGIVIGDCCWLAAMQQLGARRLILLSALKPFVAAGFGVLCLHEQLPWRALAALALTMAGVLAAALPSKAPSSTTSSSSTHETPVCVDLTELGAECGDAVEEAALLDQPVSAPVPCVPCPYLPSKPLSHLARTRALKWSSVTAAGGTQ